MSGKEANPAHCQVRSHKGGSGDEDGVPEEVAQSCANDDAHTNNHIQRPLRVYKKKYVGSELGEDGGEEEEAAQPAEDSANGEEAPPLVDHHQHSYRYSYRRRYPQRDPRVPVDRAAVGAFDEPGLVEDEEAHGRDREGSEEEEHYLEQLAAKERAEQTHNDKADGEGNLVLLIEGFDAEDGAGAAVLDCGCEPSMA